jgi:hypothetical protein
MLLIMPQNTARSTAFAGSLCTVDESKFITAHELAPDAGVTEF